MQWIDKDQHDAIVHDYQARLAKLTQDIDRLRVDKDDWTRQQEEQ